LLSAEQEHTAEDATPVSKLQRGAPRWSRVEKMGPLVRRGGAIGGDGLAGAAAAARGVPPGPRASCPRNQVTIFEPTAGARDRAAITANGEDLWGPFLEVRVDDETVWRDWDVPSSSRLWTALAIAAALLALPGVVLLLSSGGRPGPASPAGAAVWQSLHEVESGVGATALHAGEHVVDAAIAAALYFVHGGISSPCLLCCAHGGD